MTDPQGSPGKSESPASFLAGVVLGTLAAESLLSSQQLQRFTQNFRKWLIERATRQQEARSTSPITVRISGTGFNVSLRLERTRESSDPFQAGWIANPTRLDSYQQSLLRIREQRNNLTHGFAQDREALMRDQGEIRDDYRVALLTLLANERPDLLLRAAEALLRSQSGTDQESRVRLMIIAALRDAIANPNIGLPKNLKLEDIPGYPTLPKDI